jgi:hypothetical protein
MARRWLDILPAKVQAWNIPAGMIERLEDVTSGTIATQDQANSPEGTKGDAARMRTAFADLGLEPPDMIRTPHIDVPEVVDFVIHLSSIRELVIDFWIQGEAHKAKPLGYDGAVIVWGIRDTPPEHPDELPHHIMASRTSHTLTFEEGQSNVNKLSLSVKASQQLDLWL